MEQTTEVTNTPTPDAVIEEDTSQDTPMEALERPLFDEVAPSEAELSGAEEETAEAKEDEAKETETSVEEEKVSTEEPAKKVEEKAVEEKAESEKPPAGYVPHAALHEEQVRGQQLAQEVNYLRQEIDALKTTSQEDDPEALKVLSDQEFDELAEDDPAEAVKYQRNLGKHLREQDAVVAKNKVQEDQYYEDQAVISQSTDRMEKIAPGIHDENSPVNRELGEFATAHGFDPDYLAAMTSPGTLILPEGGKHAVLLGDGAAGLVGMIHKLYTASTGKASAKTHAKKLGPGKIGGTITDTPEEGLTEADYAKMSSQEREEALGG